MQVFDRHAYLKSEIPQVFLREILSFSPLIFQHLNSLNILDLPYIDLLILHTPLRYESPHLP